MQKPQPLIFEELEIQNNHKPPLPLNYKYDQ